MGLTLGPCENVSPIHVASPLKPKPNSQENLSNQMFSSFAQWKPPASFFFPGISIKYASSDYTASPHLPGPTSPPTQSFNAPFQATILWGCHWFRGHWHWWEEGPPEQGFLTNNPMRKHLGHKQWQGRRYERRDGSYKNQPREIQVSWVISQMQH